MPADTPMTSKYSGDTCMPVTRCPSPPLLKLITSKVNAAIVLNADTRSRRSTKSG